MGKEKRSFASCFLIFAGVAAVIVAILLASMDYIQEKLQLDKPTSKVGRAIDEMIPHMEAVNNYAKAKDVLQTYEMRRIKDAFVMYYVQYDRPPKSIQEMIHQRMVDQGALQDLWQHQYLYLPYEREVFLVSPGPDRIRNTDDDKMITLMAPTLEVREEDQGTVRQMMTQYALYGTTEPTTQ